MDSEIMFIARIDEMGKVHCTGNGKLLENEEQAVDFLIGSIKFIGDNIDLSPVSFMAAMQTAMSQVGEDNPDQMEIGEDESE